MEIKDFINIDNDNIIPRESKMIANLLLSGSEYRSYPYKYVTDEIYKHYHCYIRFNRYDKFASDKDNVAKKDIGYYAGEVSKLCCALGYPLLSVNIVNQSSDMPEQGFYDLCDQLNVLIGSTKLERKKYIRDLIADNFEEIKENLSKYLNDGTGKIEIEPIIKQEKEEKFVKKVIESEVDDFASNTTDIIEKPEYNDANNLTLYEGLCKELTISQKDRNKKIIKLVKERDNYTCQACGFYYENKIVEAHHLIPISSKDGEYVVTSEHLVTLCPNCHSLAHILLEKDVKYTNKKTLISELKAILKQN